MTLLLSLLVACSGGSTTFRGTKMSEFFPYDGSRQAEYVNDDTTNVGWKLVVEKIEPLEQIGGVEVATFEWTRDDTGEILGAVKWASGAGDGIHIYGYAVGTGEFTTFDPPIAFTDESDYMNPGESVETQTGGMTFTSTFVAVEDCPVAMGTDWEDCVHIELDDGDGDPMAGPLFAGDYWLAAGYGPAWMITTGFEQKWDLIRYEWTPEE